MGADLYLRDIYEENKKKWEPEFYKAIKERDALPNGAKKDEAQKRVNEAYNQMHASGYFRDSYNDSSLIWKYDLSWWGGLDGFMNKNSEITPTKAKKLLQYLDDNRETFLEKIKDYPAYSEEGKLDQMYFKAKLTDFRFFLLEAIKNKQSIDCSV